MTLLLASVAAVLAYQWMAMSRSDDLDTGTWRSTAVTSYPGNERFPSLSQDGQEVVFARHAVESDNYDIYAQPVQGGTPLQLSSDPRHDWGPVWSPKGRSIAFLRWSPGLTAELIVMTSLPGPERKLATTAPLPGRGPICGGYLAWSPDGDWIAASDRERDEEGLGLFVVSTRTGEKRRLTRPERGQWDTAPAFAPDGSALAFVRVLSFGISEIYWLRLSPDGHPMGDAAPLTALRRLSTSPAWNPAGSEVLFSSGDVFTDRQLYRVPVKGATDSKQPRRVSAETPDSTVFTVSRDMNRVLYGREFFDPNIWLLERSADGGSVTTRVFAPSTYIDLNPRFSADGQRIAFESSRTGHLEIWTVNYDGSNLSQLTFIGGAPTGSPSWSPDGRHIAFNSGTGGLSHVYLVRSEGGTPSRLTRDDANESLASWSAKGWIYFTSIRSGTSQIWKVQITDGDKGPAGPAIQVTKNGGSAAIESADGTALYFSRRGKDGLALWEMNLSDGSERQVLPSLNDAAAFAPTRFGIFFVPRTNLASSASIHFLDFAQRSTTMIAQMDRPIMVGMSAHPNGRWLLYSQVDREESDLILLQKTP